MSTEATVRTAVPDQPPAGAGIGGRARGRALAILLTGAFMILLDATIVNVAIPPIQRDLRAGYGAVEWVLSGYALAYGLLLIPAGRLGDRFGHRRLFAIGLAGFTLTSAMCGLATSPAQLVLWRVLQGAMAGVMNPPVLALIQAMYEPRERGKAFAWYGAVAGVSTAAGPLLGGLLIAWDLHGWGWRPIFMINVPVGAAALALAPRLPRVRGRGGELDAVGLALVAAAMLLITYPLVQGQSAGWPAWTFVSLAAAVPTLALFAAWELRRLRHGRAPLVDVRLFANRSFAAGVGIGLSYFAGFIGLLFALSLYLQVGLGRSALAAGLTVLPFAAGSFAGAAASDALAGRLGRRVLHLGTGLLIAGIAVVIATIRAAGPDVSGLALLPGLLAGGIGSGLVIAPNVDLVLAGVPRRDAGSASGVLNTAQRIGQALGIAVVGVALFGTLGAAADRAAASVAPSLRAELTANGLPGPAADRAVAGFTRCFHDRANAADPSAVPASCPRPAPGDPVGRAFERAAAGALAEGFTRAVQVAAAYALAAVVLTALLVFLLPAGELGHGRGGAPPAA